MHRTHETLWWCWAVAGALFAAVITLSGAPGWNEEPAEAAAIRWIRDPQVALSRSVHFPEAEAIVASRCAMCHARAPLWPGLSHAPKAVFLETADDIVHNASLIDVQAVRSHAMPPGNVTGLEPEERRILSAWIQSGDGIYGP